MSPVVIKHFDIVNDITLSCLSGFIFCEKYPICFQGAEKALRHSIIPAIAFTSHAADHSIVLQHHLKVIAAVLASAVRMEDKARLKTTTPDCHVQGVPHQFSGNTVVH